MHVAALVVAVLVALPGAAAAAELELFVRPGCPRCAEARAFLEDLRRERPQLEVAVHDVAADAAARARLGELVRRAGVRPAGVPALLVRGTLVVGFDRAATTGARVRALLDAPPGAPLVEPGTCAVAESECDQGAADLPVFGRVRLRDVGLPAFTLILGLVDGFNPCAMWVLLLVLSFLVGLGDRLRTLAIGGTFVLVGGLVYYAFMAAWLEAFQLLGVSREIQVGLGLLAAAAGAVHVKDFFALHRGPSLSIPERVKPGLYARMRALTRAERLGPALAGAVTLAVLVNLVELACTAGLPMLYTQVLLQRELPAWQHHAYLGLYVTAYMADDALMLGIAVMTLGRRKLQERGGRVLKLISGLVLIVLGLVLALRPEWLGSGPAADLSRLPACRVGVVVAS